MISEREIRNILGKVPGLVYRCLKDPDWTVEYISEGSFPLTGYHPDELILNRNMPYRSIIHSDDRRYVSEEIHKSIMRKEQWEIEYRIITRDNIGKWVFERGQVSGLNPEGIEILEGFITDITDQKKSENDMRVSEEQYRTLFENTGSGIIVIEEDTTISLANQIFADNTGYTREEIQNRKKWTEMVYKDDIEYALKEHHLRRENPSQARSSYECRFINRNNEIGYYLLFVSVIPGTKRSIASLVDITDRKKAEAALEAAEEKYRNLLMNAPIGIFRTEVHMGLLLEANDCFAQLFGYRDRDDMLSEPVYIENFYVDKNARKEMVDILKEHGEIKNYEAEFIRRDGSTFWIRYSVNLVADKGWIEGINEDITDLKISEEERNIIFNELIASEKKYRLIFENSPMGLFHFNKSGIITDCNPAFEKITESGWSVIIGQDMLKLYNAGIVSAAADALYGYPANYQGVYRILKSGKDKLVNIQFEPAYDEHKTITGGIGIVQDITYTRGVERAIFDELEKERSRIGHILHDSLGQKLGAVLYLSQAFHRKYNKIGKLSEHDLGQLVEIASSALEETRTLSRGLDLSVIDTGGFIESLGEVAMSTRSVYGIDVDIDVKDSINCFEKLKLVNLYYIILESINNAIKHGRASKILLRYYMESTKGFFIIESRQRSVMKNENSGMGLRIMKYRAEVAGMDFSISSEGKKVVVAVSLGDCHDDVNIEKQRV